MALKLTLKPGEKFVINGAVVVNGDRRGHLLIQNNVSLLREKDVMQQEHASTPVRRIYFAIQMMYLDESSRDMYYREFDIRLRELMQAISDPEALADCESVRDDVATGHYYTALITCRRLFPFEEARLNYVLTEESKIANAGTG